MKSVLLGVLLGLLLTVVQPTPVTTATQIPVKAEDEVLQEALTDGFLVDGIFPPAPKGNTSIAASQQPDHSGPNVGAANNQSLTSVLILNEASPENSPVPPQNTSHFLDVLSLGSGSDSGSGDGDEPFTHPKEETSTAPPTSTTTVHPRLFAENEGSGSELIEETTRSTSSTTTVPNMTLPRLFGDSEGSGSELTTETSTTSTTSATTTPPAKIDGFELIEKVNVVKVNTELLNQQSTSEVQIPDKGNTEASAGSKGGTPGWIIILGFIVGVAALVMLCVAIATRDKWNGPSQVSLPTNKSKCVVPSQQREQEMETFLPKEQPKENGKAAEYTVIPLDELPENSLPH